MPSFKKPRPQNPLRPAGHRKRARTFTVASPNALYVVEGGGNDARAGLPGGIAAYLTNIDTIVQGLKDAGAQHIVVWERSPEDGRDRQIFLRDVAA